MKKKYLGNTGLKVSQLGLGVGGIFGMKSFNETKALDLIYKSIDSGITFLDTGSAYSYGNAEIRLGKALGSSNLDSLVISTKGGTVLSKGYRFIKNFSPKSLMENLEKSLTRLRLEKIDLFQLHSPSLNDINHDVFNTIERMKKDGKILYSGVSCDGEVLNKAINSNFFDSFMSTYNIINTGNGKQLKKAKLKNLGTIAKSPLAHIVFSNKIFKINDIASLWYFLRIIKNYKTKFFQGYKYRFINGIDGFSSTDIALNYVARNKNIDIIMIGTTKIKHLLENIKSLEKKYPEKIFNKIEKIQQSII
jgi:aryl-alcohol dehydrogenase-like predicted oxidoreductase